MGQYRQWLHYREVDQQLHAQLAQLIEERTILHKRVQPLADGLSLSDNTIIHALLAQLHPASSASQPIVLQEKTDEQMALDASSTVPEDLDLSRRRAEETGIGVSPALHGWTNLPNFDSQQVPILPPAPSSSTKPEAAAPAITTHPELDLLPEDLASFVDEHTQTAQFRIPPRWLRDILANTTEQERPSVISQQNERTNQLVERWLKRWGRSDEEPQREDQNNER